ncbi:MAG: glycosyltransferase family 2 protein [bacterium]|nr:glycosyltransferase family 2 protein [bacterium]
MTTMVPIRVSIAVITANRSDLLIACLRSLQAGTYPLHEILVYDNGSTDDTAARLAAEFPAARHIRHTRNMGLSYCHNRAMHEFSGDCVFLVDDDNEAEPDLLEQIVRHMYATGHERIGIAGPVIMDFYAKENVVLTGGATSLWTGRNLLNTKRMADAPAIMPSLRAPNSTLIRREVIDDVGYMDEQLFSTSADEDYIRRMAARGWRCDFVRDAVIYHKAKPSDTYARQVGLTNPARAYILARNRTVLIRRYSRWYQLLAFLCVWQWLWHAFYLHVLVWRSPDLRMRRAYLRGIRDAWRYCMTGELPPLDAVLALL